MPMNRRKTIATRKTPLLAALLLLLTLPAPAQSTRVKGRVTDADTGEALPFVSICFKDTQIGVSTDMDGCYTLETRDTAARVLHAFLLGYAPAEQRVRQRSFNEINFRLKVSPDMLKASTVKPDNHYLKRILSQIRRNRDRNDPEKIERYQCSVYNKMELDLGNPDASLTKKLFHKDLGFVFQYIDTSVISGRPYLPMMMAESVVRRYHEARPPMDKETITASRISGLNPDNAFREFTSSLKLPTNFYRDFISAVNVDVPSPLSGTSELYYNYYLIDSLRIDGRKTWKIRFHPKKFISSPAFDGEMSIDSLDFALRSIHAKLQKSGKVNWVKDLVIDVENRKIGDSVWFPRDERLYVDLAVQLTDSSTLATLIGHRDLLYYDPDFRAATDTEIRGRDHDVHLEENATRRDEDYWEDKRPYRLSEKEKNIYKMVEQVKQTSVYRNIYLLANMFVGGYLEFGKLGYGPVSRLTSSNPIEGRRFQFGLQTTRELSRKYRLTGFAAYGLQDRGWKGGGKFEYMFGTQPFRKLTVTGKTDLTQLGRGPEAFSDVSIFYSTMSKGGGDFVKKSRIDECSVQYEHEFNPDFSSILSIGTRRIHANATVPMFRPDSTAIGSVASNVLRYTMRFSHKETVTRGVYKRQYIYSRYPVLTLDLMGSVKGLWRNSYNFLRVEAGLSYRLDLPPAGISRIRLNAGKIFGKVPYPMLKLHEGNSTYFIDQSAFSCMNYYEFASDSWATCVWEHNFEGFFLGKIPLLRKLNLREVLTVKAACGSLSDRNNGIPDGRKVVQAELLFPEGMGRLRKPYVEMGVGVTNILRMFRVDYNWRLTYRTREAGGVREKVPYRHSINVGLDFSF